MAPKDLGCPFPMWKELGIQRDSVADQYLSQRYLRYSRHWRANILTERGGMSPHNYGSQRLYVSNPADFQGRRDVIRWESLRIDGSALIRLRFVDSHATEPQGVFLFASHEIEINGLRGRAMDVWNDTAPAEIEIMPSPDTKFVSFYHVARDGGARMSQGGRMGMLLEEAGPRCFRYACTNNGVEFDSLVFEIEFVSIASDDQRSAWP